MGSVLGVLGGKSPLSDLLLLKAQTSVENSDTILPMKGYPRERGCCALLYSEVRICI